MYVAKTGQMLRSFYREQCGRPESTVDTLLFQNSRERCGLKDRLLFTCLVTVHLVVVFNYLLVIQCYTEDSCRPAIIDSRQKQRSQISFHALSFQKI